MVANDSLCIMMSEEGLMSSRVVLLFLFLILHWLSFPDVGAAQQSSEKALREHYDLQEGKRLYGEYCRFCHGEQGKGHAFNVTPPPADLTSPAVQRKSDIELTQTIHEGERGTAMGSWKWALSKKEKQEVLLYIRWLSQSRQPVSAPSP
jgi:mono/diheme cytochrome c family protein